jgi:hypothetical protein
MSICTCSSSVYCAWHLHSDYCPSYMSGRITALEGILDAISDMEGQEGMTDAKFARNTLKLIEHGVVQ